MNKKTDEVKTEVKDVKTEVKAEMKKQNDEVKAEMKQLKDMLERVSWSNQVAG